MPIPAGFADRLNPVVESIAARVGTPFYVYDVAGIVAAHRAVADAFRHWPHRQHFAIKALPNPAILQLLLTQGSGLDCSSPVELALAERCGARGRLVVFTSSNTEVTDLAAAEALGARITFDDLRYFERLATVPESVCFRLVPGAGARSALMGSASESKFGMAPDMLVDAYRIAQARGVRRYGIYGMACANELEATRAILAGRELLDVAIRVERELGIRFDHVNFGGGIGIPYRPGERSFDLKLYADSLIDMVAAAFPGRRVSILTEFGRYITGPSGVLVTKVVSRMHKRREHIGVDASMAALVRPALYGAYHHITLPLRPDAPVVEADVVGPMCENGDRFATARAMSLPDEGDLLYIHDAGAHAHAMGITYNGRLRPAEVVLRENGEAVLIRRAETLDDYLATLVDRSFDLAAPVERVA